MVDAAHPGRNENVGAYLRDMDAAHPDPILTVDDVGRFVWGIMPLDKSGQTLRLVQSHEALRALVEELRGELRGCVPVATLRAAERLAEELTAERDEFERQMLYTREAAREIIERKAAAEREVTALRAALTDRVACLETPEERPRLSDPVSPADNVDEWVTVSDLQRLARRAAEWETPRIVSSTTIQPLEPETG